ncbi:MAG: HIT family protein [Flavobacteriales bacterium]|nr:HIT family protein [Flavobacteriales bacterium]
MPSIFSKIIAREIPSFRVAENEEFIAFLDIQPLAPGHTLVVPKMEVDYIFDLPHEVYERYWIFARKVASAIESVETCKRIGIAVIGLEVPHAHIHLVPINYVGDINFSKPKMEIPSEEQQQRAERIRAVFEKLPVS